MLLFSCSTTKEVDDISKQEKIKDGHGKIYWKDGSMRGEGNFKNYSKVGNWTLYHKGSGEKQAEGKFLNDKQQGKWIYFHKSGPKSMLGSFRGGQKNGQWKAFHKNGKLLWKAKYVIRKFQGMDIGGIEGTKISYYEWCKKNGFTCFTWNQLL